MPAEIISGKKIAEEMREEFKAEIEKLKEEHGITPGLAVVLVGEIGGVYEEMTKPTIENMKKPVIGMVGGLFAPPGKRMGHAGAIVEGEMGTAQTKMKALEEAGAHIAKTFLDIPMILEKLKI